MGPLKKHLIGKKSVEQIFMCEILNRDQPNFVSFRAFFANDIII